MLVFVTNSSGSDKTVSFFCVAKGKRNSRERFRAGKVLLSFGVEVKRSDIRTKRSLHLNNICGVQND